jgi:DNA-directed RNA polymerase II subunit RPB1
MEPGLWELLARLQPKYRLKYVWEKAKSTFVCAETDPADEDNPMPVGHNGCGHRQPLIRKEGLKMFTVDKRIGEEEDSKKKKVRIVVNTCRHHVPGRLTPLRRRSITASTTNTGSSSKARY